MNATDAVVSDLFTSHQARLERYVRSLGRDSDETADVCQEVAVRLLLAARAGRLPEAPAAWMNRVAHNLVVSAARRRQTSERAAARIVERESVPSTEDLFVAHERDDAIRLALDSARADDRRAMVMAASGFRTAEIADRIGRTELATRALLCRARGRMRDRLDVAGVA
jgi:RNA polymerase sigma factor (sigma-70 family)